MSRSCTEPVETVLLNQTFASSDNRPRDPSASAVDAEQITELDGSRIVGRYCVKEELARGGMGVVLRAYDQLLHRDVAIKLLLAPYLDQPESVERFVTEALLTSRLQHPCIVPVYDRGYSKDARPFFAMKLISGQPLSAILSDGPDGQQDRLRLLKIFETVCQTLAYSHWCGILHLDIKPSNIMVGEFGEVHLMDWGLARTFLPDDPSPAQKQTERIVSELSPDRCCEPRGTGGTPAYMSPEQARGDVVGPKSDVFALGGILCEILTGRPPYKGADNRRLHRRAIRGLLHDARSCLDDCAEDRTLIELAKGCLEPKQANRIASAKEVASVINAYLETALEQAESDVYRFFDLTLDLFCIATLDGFFERVNVNFSRVLGYTSEELISRPFLDFIHADDLDDTLRVMSDLTSGKSIVKFCNRYRHAHGHYLTLEWTAKPLPEERSIFAVARDVTDRYRPSEPSRPGWQ